MDNLFQGLKGKLSDAGTAAKGLADIAQLTTANSEAEKKISQLYTKLGQLYFETYKDDASANGANLMEDIKALQAIIQLNHDKINDLKGIVKCEKCGAEVSNKSAFCSRCGSPIVVPILTPPTPTGRVCPNCSNIVPEDNLFCNNCGTKMDATSANPTVEGE